MLRVVLLLFFFSTGTANQLSSLLRRMGNLEHRVDVLDEKVDNLKAELLQDTKSQVEFDFKVTDISASCDTECRYTVLYEAKGDQPTVLIGADNGFPNEMVDHSRGTVQFAMPIDVASPTVAIITSSGLEYTLFLGRPGGPEPAANISNVAFSSVPSITFKKGDHPEFGFSSTVVGTRKVKRQELRLIVVPLYPRDGPYVFPEYFTIENGREGEEGEGGEAEEQTYGPLRVVESDKDGIDRSYRFRVDTGYGDAGLLVLQRIVFWDCTGGCTVFTTIVREIVLYYRDDLYEVPDGDFFPYPIGQPEHENYVAFIRDGPDDVASSTMVEGEPDFIFCGVVGESPRVSWSAGNTGNATVSSITLRHMASSHLRFNPVTKEDEGEYECQAESGDVHLSRTFTLRVTEHEEYGNYTGEAYGNYTDEAYGNYTDEAYGY